MAPAIVIVPIVSMAMSATPEPMTGSAPENAAWVVLVRTISFLWDMLLDDWEFAAIGAVVTVRRPRNSLGARNPQQSSGQRV
jgi:hypothetical protein